MDPMALEKTWENTTVLGSLEVDQHISEMVSSEANKPVEANMAVAEKHETLESFFFSKFWSLEISPESHKDSLEMAGGSSKIWPQCGAPQFWVGL